MTLKELKELKEKSTKVVGWHASGEHVKGPFYRWFTCTEAVAEYADQVATRADDAKYCAAAMNALPQLIERVEKLSEAVEILTSECSSKKEFLKIEIALNALPLYGSEVPLT